MTGAGIFSGKRHSHLPGLQRYVAQLQSGRAGYTGGFQPQSGSGLGVSTTGAARSSPRPSPIPDTWPWSSWKPVPRKCTLLTQNVGRPASSGRKTNPFIELHGKHLGKPAAPAAEGSMNNSGRILERTRAAKQCGAPPAAPMWSGFGESLDEALLGRAF